jgi:hypothetical protein
VAGCEREGVPRLMRQTIPANPFKRLAAFLLGSGSANGIAWSSLVLTISLAACLAHYGWSVDEEFWIIVGIVLYLFAYVNTSVYIRNKWFAAKLKKGYTWLVTLLLLTLFTFGPWVTSLLLMPGDWTNMSKVGLLHVFNPFAMGAPNAPLAINLIAALAWCVVISILQARWFFNHYKVFRPVGAAAKPGTAGE